MTYKIVRLCISEGLLPFLVTYAFGLVGIKRYWNSTEGGSKLLGVERVSVTKQIPSMHRVNGKK